MKKLLAILTSLALGAGILSGCGGNTPVTEKTDKLHIVTTIFPAYDWTQTLLGENAENADLTLLLDQGVDLHSYQPTADDLIEISACDMFLYVGGESDAWVEKALENPKNPNRVVINLLDVLGDAVKMEETVEGMQETAHDHDNHDADDHDAHDDHDHDTHDDHDDNDDHDHEPEADEHVWLSLRNAEVLCAEIANQLSVIDPAHKDAYAKNLSAYAEKLSTLDAQYAETVQDGAQKTLLFGDRFPFRYLVDDYGLTYYAAFSGCSSETEASFETVAFLANKVDELHLSCVVTIEGGQHKIAKTIIGNTNDKNQQVVTLDSMQSTTSQDIKNGVTYLSIMEHNLQVLKDALH